jgi:hypothetical protein
MALADTHTHVNGDTHRESTKSSAVTKVAAPKVAATQVAAPKVAATQVAAPKVAAIAKTPEKEIGAFLGKALSKLPVKTQIEIFTAISKLPVKTQIEIAKVAADFGITLGGMTR